MKIGIDISQMAFKGSGVAEYVGILVKNLLEADKENEYILFFSSMRRDIKDQILNLKTTNKKLKIKKFKFPPIALDILWNRFHILPIENFIGDVDVFISSDWTQPPTRRAKSVTVLYDLIVYKYPKDLDKKIIETQKRRLAWVKKECDRIICISDATKKDAMAILGIEEQRLKVIFPGT